MAVWCATQQSGIMAVWYWRYQLCYGTMVWHYGIVAFWHYGTMTLWHYGNMALWYVGTINYGMTLWHYGIMALWQYGIMARWHYQHYGIMACHTGSHQIASLPLPRCQLSSTFCGKRQRIYNICSDQPRVIQFH